MKKPIVGITCNYDYKDEIGKVSHMGITGQKWHFLADNYVSAVEQAGGVPVLIPICGGMETIKEMIKMLDGVLISGGHDVNPQEYGEKAKGYCGTIMPMRDRQDIGLTRYILEETTKPILGICRGIQVINVAAGGNLYQDLEKEGEFEHHFIDIYPLNHPTHSVKVEEGSRLSEIFKKKTVKTNSFHHQAIKEAGKNFLVTALSEDGVVEAIERKDSRFAVGVQWHPEMMYDSEEQQKIFNAFIEACR